MYARINPYTGEMELAGIDFVIQSRPPTYSDASYAVPTMWIDDSNDAIWILLRVTGSVGYWLLLGTIDPYGYGTEDSNTLVAESGDTLILQ